MNIQSQQGIYNPFISHLVTKKARIPVVCRLFFDVPAATYHNMKEPVEKYIWKAIHKVQQKISWRDNIWKCMNSIWH